MRILLTGVSGQVGGALLPLLHQHEVLAAGRTTLDLTQLHRIETTLDRLTPDMIVNPAAYTAVDRAEGERELAMLVNASAPAALARWAAENSVPLVHFSTDYVFDGSGELPWHEDDPPRPLSIYGESKLAGEYEIQAAGGTFLIVRTSWIYAARGTNFLRTIARLARERRELRIINDQIGAPTSARLIAEAVVAMIGDDREAFSGRCNQARGLVNVAASGETSWHGFACAIVDGLEARGVPLTVERLEPITTEQYATRARRPRNSRLDLSRLRQIFGLNPPHWRDLLAPEIDTLAQELAQ